MLPDDHEYWNDYSFYDCPIPLLWTLKLPHVREAWGQAARDGVFRVQRSPVVEQFSVGEDLSICLADVRSHRSEEGFLRKPQMRLLENWARNLKTPGIVALCQPLIVEEGEVEKNLRNYEDQYCRLMNALGKSGHDVVLLTGDVHFGRVASVALTGGQRLIEVISSPMSNLTGLNGIATGTPKAAPERTVVWARDRKVIRELAHGLVDYYKRGRVRRFWDWFRRLRKEEGEFFVPTYQANPLAGYPKRRTAEHFMTVGFSKIPTAEVGLSVDCWLIRERDADGLPKRGFEKPFRAVLKRWNSPDLRKDSRADLAISSQ